MISMREERTPNTAQPIALGLMKERPALFCACCRCDCATIQLPIWKFGYSLVEGGEWGMRLFLETFLLAQKKVFGNIFFISFLVIFHNPTFSPIFGQLLISNMNIPSIATFANSVKNEEEAI
jgi:hypothetical protein